MPIPIFALVVLWLVGWSLRVPILAAPPLAIPIADAFDLGESGVASLTMLPVLAIAFGAIPAAWVVLRFGVRGAIAGGMLVMAVASAARGQVPTAALLFAASALMGLGVAVFQTALPAATQRWAPAHAGLASAVYLNGMMVGELSGAGLTLPLILPLADGDWTRALILWSLPIVAIALLVAVVRFCAEDANAKYDVVARGRALPRWNDKFMYQYGVLLASATVKFFAINAFFASMLESRGELHALAQLLFAFNAMPLIASAVVLAAPKWIGVRAPLALAAVLSTAGLLGFVVFDGAPSWAAALLVGCASTVELILVVALPPTIARGDDITRLAAGTTLVGLTIAFALPLIGGWLADVTDKLQLALIPSLLFALLALFALGKCARFPRYAPRAATAV